MLWGMTFPEISRYLVERRKRIARQERKMKRQQEAQESRSGTKSNRSRAITDKEYLRMKAQQERKQKEYEARAAKPTPASQNLQELKAAFAGFGGI